MHEPIRDHLEEYLRCPEIRVSNDFLAHLEGCKACASELELLEIQAELLRSLRAEKGIEPRAGFYARVMDRIEREGQQTSIWSILLQPRVGRRLAVATATLALLLAGYLISTEPGDQTAYSAPSAVVTEVPASDAALTQDVLHQQQRDAVLVNLASFRQ